MALSGGICLLQVQATTFRLSFLFPCVALNILHLFLYNPLHRSAFWGEINGESSTMMQALAAQSKLVSIGLEEKVKAGTGQSCKVWLLAARQGCDFIACWSQHPLERKDLLFISSFNCWRWRNMEEIRSQGSVPCFGKS